MPSPLNRLGQPSLVPKTITRRSSGYDTTPLRQEIAEQPGIFVIQGGFIETKAAYSFSLK